MQAQSVEQLIGQTLDGYRIERLLGKGRLSAVFLAQNLATRRTDALTLYHVPESFPPEARQRFLKRFLKGASAMSVLQHKHILPVYASGECQGYPYLVTPYMMHGSLADALKRQGRYEHVDALGILEQVGSGLEYAHQKGYIHGTLRPSNIVLDKEDNLLVAGFGLMHMLQSTGIVRSERPYRHLLSIAETLMIAPEYVAPEIVQGQTIDKRSDIYGLGAILFELLSGQPPFSGDDPLEVAKRHVKYQAPSLRSICPDVPVALESVVNQALERDPSRRFQSVGELTEAFGQVSHGTGKLHNTGEQQASSGKTAQQQTTGSWQLVPPIVTGHFSALPSAASSSRERSAKPAQSPIVSQKMPAAQPPAPVEAQESMQPYDWWSMAGPVQESTDPAHAEVKPLRVRESQPAQPQGKLRLSIPDTAMEWDEQFMRQQSAVPRPRIKMRSAKVKRRRFIATLAVGGVLLGGGAFAYEALHNIHNPTAANTPNKGTNNNQSKTNATKANGHTGNVIGMNDMAVNSAIAFTNPGDNKASLLIRLPGGQFVAYERACTHQQVNVNYDPGTHTLVCPLHGSIFDPAAGGKVLQGPAQMPLPPVGVRINADGTITTNI